MRSKRPAIRISHRDVLFEDDDYLALNKRRGWPVHRTVDASRSNVFDALDSFLRNRDGAPPQLSMPHRLDVWTSGVLLFAKSEVGKKHLAALFEKREIRKIYLGKCEPSPREKSGELHHFLKPKKVDGKERMTPVRSGGKKAITRYRVLEEQGSACLVEFELVTGRRHQIRAQSADAGFPLIGDALYGARAVNQRYDIEGQLLHASELSFVDPRDGESIAIRAPLPEVFEAQQPERQSPEAVLFYKPYGVLCQFTAPTEDERTMADFALPKNIYAAGRLDKDSEGLVVLTRDGKANQKLANPQGKTWKEYWVQVEGVPSAESLATMAQGVMIRGYRTKPCRAHTISPAPAIPPRDPPIRVRKNIATTWLSISLQEGKNRQIRRMTAAIGHPTLRLIRIAVGELGLGELAPGEWRAVPLPS